MFVEFSPSAVLLAPLQSFIRWLMPNEKPEAVRPSTSASAWHPALPVRTPVRARRAGNPAPCQSKSNPTRTLRVIRLLEAGQPQASVGRMVISGRMADVCAELDRLVACEGTQH